LRILNQRIGSVEIIAPGLLQSGHIRVAQQQGAIFPLPLSLLPGKRLRSFFVLRLLGLFAHGQNTAAHDPI
jgi:hypothetical protein